VHICVTISAVHILSNFLAGDIHKFFSDYIIPCVYTFMTELFGKTPDTEGRVSGKKKEHIFAPG